MKNILFTLLILYTVNCYAQSPEWEWARSAGGTLSDEANTVATDDFGNTYVAGYFQSPSITFGLFSKTNYSGHKKMFLVKYDQGGDVIWLKTADETGDNIPKSIAVDNIGNIYLAGDFDGPFIVFGDNSTDTLMNSDAISFTSDFFLAKYDTNGNILWARSSKPVNASWYKNAMSVCADNNGNSYISGSFIGIIIWGNDTIINDNADHVFLAKYDANGNDLWARELVGDSMSTMNSVICDINGNVFVTGKFMSSTITFVGAYSISNNGDYDVFIAKYNSDGTVLWAKNAGCNYFDEGTSLAADDNGNVYLTGYSLISNSVIFNQDTLTFNNPGYYNVFLAKYDPAGNIVWVKGGSGHGYGTFKSNTVTVNNAGVYMAGWFDTDTISFGQHTLIQSGSYGNIFLAKYTSDGTIVSAKGIGGGEYSNFDYRVEIDRNGTVLVGSFSGSTITFGNTTLSKAGESDVFVAKFGDMLHAFAGEDTAISCGGTIQLNSTSDYCGSGTLSYQWYPSAYLNFDTIPNPIADVNSTTTFVVEITDPGGASATDSITISFNPMINPGICYVEFDTLTSKNNIVWTPLDTITISSVIIYYETSTNVWIVLDTVSATQNSYIDVNSNPFNQSYSYRIALEDKCENITTLSDFHTTITLLSMYDIGSNTYGFAWSPYAGIAISNYYLYGVTASGSETLIGSVPGNQYFYNYTNPFIGFKRYFIGFNSNSCTAKVNYLVKSNYVLANTGIIENEEELKDIDLFPNPVSNILNIQTNIECIPTTNHVL